MEELEKAAVGVSERGVYLSVAQPGKGDSRASVDTALIQHHKYSYRSISVMLPPCQSAVWSQYIFGLTRVTAIPYFQFAFSMVPMVP